LTGAGISSRTATSLTRPPVAAMGHLRLKKTGDRAGVRRARPPRGGLKQDQLLALEDADSGARSWHRAMAGLRSPRRSEHWWSSRTAPSALPRFRNQPAPITRRSGATAAGLWRITWPFSRPGRALIHPRDQPRAPADHDPIHMLASPAVVSPTSCSPHDVVPRRVVTTSQSPSSTVRNWAGGHIHTVPPAATASSRPAS